MKKLVYGIVSGLFICGLTTGCASGGAGEEGISPEEYEQIRLGMSLTEVSEIVGGSGEQISEEEEDRVYTYVYEFPGEKSGTATITFTMDYSGDTLFASPSVSAKEKDNLS